MWGLFFEMAVVVPGSVAQREVKQQLRQLFNGLILQGMEHGVMIA